MNVLYCTRRRALPCAGSRWWTPPPWSRPCLASHVSCLSAATPVQVEGGGHLWPRAVPALCVTPPQTVVTTAQVEGGGHLRPGAVSALCVTSFVCLLPQLRRFKPRHLLFCVCHNCRRFKVVDTSGLEPFLPGDTIQARATQLTARVLNRSDVALLLIDGQ